jgi:hypothetical protein
MEQREIKQRCRTDTDVGDLQTRRNQPGYDSLGVTIGASPTVSANTNASTAGLIDDCAVHFAEQKSKIFIELLLRHSADVVFAKDQ